MEARPVQQGLYKRTMKWVKLIIDYHFLKFCYPGKKIIQVIIQVICYEINHAYTTSSFIFKKYY